jgi:hypothetical protein
MIVVHLNLDWDVITENKIIKSNMDLTGYTTEHLFSIVLESQHRQKGRTTRLIDKYIQELFNHNGEWVTINDHTDLASEQEYHLRMTKQLIDKIIQRLKFEHNYGKTDKIAIEKRLTSENKFQVKLTYKRGNEEFIDNVFQELHKRLTEYEK